MQDMPGIIFAGGGTTGFAQLGVVVGLVREGQGRLHGMGFGAGWVMKNIVPCMVLRQRLVWGDCWVGYWMELAGGFGAGGRSIIGTYCGGLTH